MNYYARYFDSENVLPNPTALVNFIASIPQITMTEELSEAVYKFCEDKTSFPRHFRLPNKRTFIVIKTNASSLEEFKTVGANGGVQNAEAKEAKEAKIAAVDEVRPGKYRVSITFRRAVVNPDTHKCVFFDETFEVEMQAQSQRQCYDVVLEHLKNHPDLDTRSQFPSIRSANFTATLVE